MPAQKPSRKGRVFFYPPEFYVFDNFSSFQIEFEGKSYPTVEHAYHSLRFSQSNVELAEKIRTAKSAHEALKISEANKDQENAGWDSEKVTVMKKLLHCKVEQHEYVLKKLLQTKDREIIEDSWRDSTWGWGADHEGRNLLGKLWMEVREEVRSACANLK